MKTSTLKAAFGTALLIATLGGYFNEVSNAREDTTSKFNYNGKTFSLRLTSANTVAAKDIEEGIVVEYKFTGPPDYIIRTSITSQSANIDQRYANALLENYSAAARKNKIKRATCAMASKTIGKISLVPSAQEIYNRAFLFYGVYC